MNTKRIKTAIAATAVIALSLSACGGSNTKDNSSSGGDSAKAEFNAGMTKVFNPSDKKGGIVKFADEGAPDSVDTGDTYYGYSWNTVRLYSRALTMFTVAPGAASGKLVGDLADGLGTASDGGKTWTYKIRKGLKFEDGTPITSKDVKYGVSRSTDKTVFPDGPAYFDSMLNWP
ncbi:MAG: peptide/nickel transport system substrate-binding protein, partial [Kribbellaceae bacterium]|nr:peptide/nickel transport system substrate-binding protein [Kribbellaceae bacterium]